MRKLAVLFVVLCACGPDAPSHEDAGVDGHPMIDAMVDAPVDAPPQCVGLDDGIACTVDTCDMATGQVTHTPNNGMCNDNVACTTDTCSATNGCEYTPENTACDDGVACTVDACDATNGCSHATMDSMCEVDGKSCTVAHCDTTAGCSEVPTNAMCDDSATCSTDACDPTANGANATTGCVYQLDNTMCADTAECSSDACSPGTTGADTTTGCLHTADQSVCDPNATCTSAFDCACNGGYMGDGLTCSGVTCDALTNPTNGTVTVTNGGAYPSTATYTCGLGFAPSPSATRTCGTDGHWSGAAPTCVPTFFVVRVGDGGATLSTAATAVFVEERLTTDGTLVRTINLPTAAGTQNALTASGTATSEGGMTRSTDGRYVVLAGYAADAGTAAVANTANISTGTGPVNRVVGRIDTTGAIDTSTLIADAFSGTSGTAGNPRSVASADGWAFWVTGTAASTTNGPGGMWYVPLGGTGAVHLEGSNLHQTSIFNGQLYETSSSTVEAVGTGLPTTAPQTPAAVAATGTTFARSFVFLDTDTTAGADRLYIAIDASSGTAGVVNIQKWTLVGGVWTKDTMFAPQLTGVTGTGSGTRGLTAWFDGTHVQLLATLAVSPGNRIIALTDDSETPTVNVLATAAANTVFRGLALSPNVAP